MSIRPIDFQITVPRSAEVAKANNTAARGETAQKMFSQEFQRKVEQENQSVIQTQKSEYNKIDKDGRNGSGQGSKKKKEEEEKKEEKKQNSTSMYDISI